MDVPSGYTRALAPPPAEGVGTEHAGLRVFSGQRGVREEQRVVEGGGGEGGKWVGEVQRGFEWARLRREEPITAQWWQDGRSRYSTSASHTGREEKEQMTPPMRATTAAARPSMANGGVAQLYTSTSHRHFPAPSIPTPPTSSSPSIQPVLDSGFTHNAHLIHPHFNHPLPPPSHLHGRALPGSGMLTSHRLATDGVGSHADWVDPAGRVGWEGRVDDGRVASAYAREERKEWGWGEEGRKVKHYREKVGGGGGLDWRTGREVKALDQMHPTVRKMGEVLQAEPFGPVKNYGVRLNQVDRDWLPQEEPDK